MLARSDILSTPPANDLLWYSQPRRRHGQYARWTRSGTDDILAKEPGTSSTWDSFGRSLFEQRPEESMADDAERPVLRPGHGGPSPPSPAFTGTWETTPYTTWRIGLLDYQHLSRPPWGTKRSSGLPRRGRPEHPGLTVCSKLSLQRKVRISWTLSFETTFGSGGDDVLQGEKCRRRCPSTSPLTPMNNHSAPHQCLRQLSQVPVMMLTAKGRAAPSRLDAGGRRPVQPFGMMGMVSRVRYPGRRLPDSRRTSGSSTGVEPFQAGPTSRHG